MQRLVPAARQQAQDTMRPAVLAIATTLPRRLAAWSALVEESAHHVGLRALQMDRRTWSDMPRHTHRVQGESDTGRARPWQLAGGVVSVVGTPRAHLAVRSANGRGRRWMAGRERN